MSSVSRGDSFRNCGRGILGEVSDDIYQWSGGRMDDGEGIGGSDCMELPWRLMMILDFFCGVMLCYGIFF